MRILIILLVILVAVPIAFSISECQRVQSEIPCNVISSWNPGSSTVPVDIYNISGNIVASYTWGDYTPVCNFTFSVNQSGTFYYNSSIENGIITVGVTDMSPLAIIILLPIIFGIMIFTGAMFLGKEHPAFKWFSFLLLPICLFASFHFAALTIVKYYNFPELQDLIGTSVYWIGFITILILVYVMMYAFTVMVRKAAQDKEDKLQY